MFASGSIWWTLKHVRLDLYRVLGRFDAWNAAGQLWRQLFFRHVERRIGTSAVFSPIFGSVPVDAVAAQLLAEGYWEGLKLPASLVTVLFRHACETKCRQGNLGETFFIGDLVDGRSPAGQAVAVADVYPGAHCPELDALREDGAIKSIVARFLGYPSTRCVTRLYWSPTSSMDDEGRRWAGQTIDFHYDIERRRTLYVYFYLTQARMESGAHVLIRRSHRGKSWRLKIASTRQTEERLFDRYSRTDIVVLEGDAGHGFVENPACYHKALPPTGSPRLMLQLRFS